eukprot:COSAG01_NODE_17826_length_1121_cov_1.724070_1_plen_315_part_10
MGGGQRAHAALAAAALLATPAFTHGGPPSLPAPPSWHVMQGVDWPHNLPGGNDCSVRAANASGCADACASQPHCAAVSWNQHTDHCCNFKCNTRGQTSKKSEQGVEVRPEADFCKLPPPPPVPAPPPSPSQLCPVSHIPAEWLAACLAAELFFEPPTGPQQQPSLLPEVGNGHLAWKLRSDAIFASGLFNGPAGSPLEGDGDKRARIRPYAVDCCAPTVAAQSTAAPAQLTSLGQALDVRRAAFLAHSVTADGVHVEERWYAPQQLPQVLVHEISLSLGEEHEHQQQQQQQRRHLQRAGAVTVALQQGLVGAPSA